MDSTSPEPRRLAALPGYDTAPDIYETLDLTDDTATTQQSASSDRGHSEASDTSDEDGNESYGVSRRRLYPERARNRFSATSARVETRGVDLSDRVDGRRKGYGVRRRVGGREDEEEESLEQRIARLRREVEECRAEVERERSVEDQEEGKDEMDGLSQLLARMEVPAPHGPRTKPSATANGMSELGEEEEGDEVSDEQLLSRVTAFDSRLAALEQTVGASSLESLTADVVSTPILPSLAVLDQQIGALTSATSLSSLEAASTRISALRREASDLAVAQSELDSARVSEADLNSLRALYTLLPNLQSFSTTVPSMISRLRSLRSLHTTAANAASALDQMEQRQAEMDKEVQAWRQGLEKVEAAVAGASEANGKNGRFVQGWVQDLEARMKTLGR